ncbi:MAG: hypothetical protein WD696_01445 [Bryobacteraceae bacterium]
MDRRAIVLVLLAWAGCAVRQPVSQNYRLVKQDTGQVLIPPGVAGPDIAQRTFTAVAAAGRGTCPDATGAIPIQVRGKRLRVTVTRETLLKQPAGWLGAWAADMEAQGCLAPGGGLNLANRIAESLPLDPNRAFRLLNWSDGQKGQVDIGPQTRLQVVSPILREGAPIGAPVAEPVDTSGNDKSLTLTIKSTENLIGYEITWYAVQPKTNGLGFTIVPLSAERHIQGKMERRPQPAVNYFQFPADAAFYRLFYKTGQTEYTALVIAARTRADLDRRARALETGSGSCEMLHDEGCIAIPKRVAVNPVLAVDVNGREVMVAWGATVREAIRQAGEPQANAVLPRLAVHKLYNGRPAPVEFDRADPAILNLILTGRETISWR